MTKRVTNKTQLAKETGVSRASLYYKPKRETLDEVIKKEIEQVLSTHKSYGHKRIALELKRNKKQILRVMKKYKIKPYRRHASVLRKKDDEGKVAVTWKNEIITLCPIRPNVIWASDFTYIKFMGRFIYLATIIDVYTREVIGWNISIHHDTKLVLGALTHAIERARTTPIYLHSDQGSEYCAKTYEGFALSKGIILSMSAKSSPWENPFQESFYSQFKVDLGFVGRFDVVEELIEEIYQTIFYYNNSRIHTKLKMNPVAFKKEFENRLAVVRITV